MSDEVTSTTANTSKTSKLSPSKQRRKEERAAKFNNQTPATNANTDQVNDTLNTNPVHSNNSSSSQSSDTEEDDTMSSSNITCPEFHYGGDQLSLGHRWNIWNEQFRLYLTATGITDNAKVKSLYLLGMGKEAYEIYATKKKPDNSDTLTEVKTFMSAHFVPKKSEYTEILTFRQAYRLDTESVSEYVMRLRTLAADCKYGENLEKEIERQFVVGCNMADVQRKCCRTDDLTLARVVEIAIGYERVDANTAKLLFSAEKPRQNINAINEARKPDDRRPSKAAYDSSKCGNCNRPAHDDKSKCPAKGLAC